MNRWGSHMNKQILIIIHVPFGNDFPTFYRFSLGKTPALKLVGWSVRVRPKVCEADIEVSTKLMYCERLELEKKNDQTHSSLIMVQWKFGFPNVKETIGKWREWEEGSRWNQKTKKKQQRTHLVMFPFFFVGERFFFNMFSLDDFWMGPGEVVTMPFVKHVQSSPWIF